MAVPRQSFQLPLPSNGRISTETMETVYRAGSEGLKINVSNSFNQILPESSSSSRTYRSRSKGSIPGPSNIPGMSQIRDNITLRDLP